MSCMAIPIPMGIPWEWDPHGVSHSHAYLYFSPCPLSVPLPPTPSLSPSPFFLGVSGRRGHLWCIRQNQSWSHGSLRFTWPNFTHQLVDSTHRTEKVENYGFGPAISRANVSRDRLFTYSALTVSKNRQGPVKNNLTHHV